MAGLTVALGLGGRSQRRRLSLCASRLAVTMRAERCSRSPCTPTSRDRRRSATSPSAPACPSRTSSRSCSPSRVPGSCAPSAVSAAATSCPATRAELQLSEIVSAVDGPISVGDFGEPHHERRVRSRGTMRADRRVERGQRVHAQAPRQLHPRRGRQDGARPGALARRRELKASPPHPRSALPAAPQVVGQRAGERDSLAGGGMVERQLGGVEERAVEPERRAPLAVRAVADERMADAGEVDADLVGPAGLQPARQQRRVRPVAEPLDDLVLGARRLARRRRPPSAVGSPGSRPIGASMMPWAAAGCPHTRAT